MATRVEYEGIEECVKKINCAVDMFTDASKMIDQAMSELPSYWEGAAYNAASAEYEGKYKQLLTQRVPQSVTDFNKFINDCKQTIIDIDSQLAGL